MPGLPTRKQRYSSVPPFGAAGVYGRAARSVLIRSPTRSGPGAGTPVEACAEWAGGAGDGAGPATGAVAPATDLSPVRSRGPMTQRYVRDGTGGPGTGRSGMDDDAEAHLVRGSVAPQ